MILETYRPHSSEFLSDVLNSATDISFTCCILATMGIATNCVFEEVRGQALQTTKNHKCLLIFTSLSKICEMCVK